MAIHVSLFAAFAEFAGARALDVDFAPGMTCLALWNQLREKYPRVSSIPPLFAVGGEYVPPETALRDGDYLMIFPPLSGGSPRYIYDTPLSVQRALEAIRDANGGGEALFIGRVRRHSEGKVIRHLFYECEPKMAEKQIGQIMEEMHAKWPLKNVHMEHRIGKLEVEEIAVIVAVSAEHRQEALEACRYGIDELKRRVPIWKKEVSEDGEEWVGICDHERGEEHG
jgi:molybdopterin synthase catalytic subunit